MEENKLETAIKFMEHTDKVNKRLANVVMCAFIVFGITVLGMVAFYFFSDYQYPVSEQQVTKDSMSQSIK